MTATEHHAWRVRPLAKTSTVWPSYLSVYGGATSGENLWLAITLRKAVIKCSTTEGTKKRWPRRVAPLQGRIAQIGHTQMYRNRALSILAQVLGFSSVSGGPSEKQMRKMRPCGARR